MASRFLPAFCLLIALPFFMAPAHCMDLQELQRAVQRSAPIHTQEQLDAELMRGSAHSPLNALSPTARDRFIRSLRFNEAGLTTFNIDPIVEELNASDARTLLSLFGVERVLPHLAGLRVESDADERVMEALARPIPGNPVLEDHPRYQCVGRANCMDSPSFICMSGC